MLNSFKRRATAMLKSKLQFHLSLARQFYVWNRPYEGFIIWTAMATSLIVLSLPLLLAVCFATLYIAMKTSNMLINIVVIVGPKSMLKISSYMLAREIA